MRYRFQDSPSLAPVLNQAKKIIRKLGAADSSSHDNLEDSMRKVNKYVRTRKISASYFGVSFVFAAQIEKFTKTSRNSAFKSRFHIYESYF